MDERKLVILVNDRITMSRGKYAAQAVHAALLALGVHPGVPVVVLGGRPSEIAEMKTTVRDAGRTEVEPGTLTAGTDWEVGDEDVGGECGAPSTEGAPGTLGGPAPAQGEGDKTST